MNFNKILLYRKVHVEGDQETFFAPANETDSDVIEQLNRVGLWRYLSLEGDRIGRMTVWHETRATPYTQAISDM